MRTLPALALGLVVALAASGCRKPVASPDYIAASNRYTNLLALHGDSAYGRPEMTEVTEQLARVDGKSLDYAKAQTLLTTIATEKNRVMSEEAKRMMAVVPAPAPNFPALAAAPATGNSPPEAGGGGNVPGAAASDVVVGADFATLNNKYVGCLVQREQVAVNLVGRDAGPTSYDGYDLKEDVSCQSRMPAMRGNVMLVRDGRVSYLLATSSLKTTLVQPDGGPISNP